MRIQTSIFICIGFEFLFKVSTPLVLNNAHTNLINIRGSIDSFQHRTVGLRMRKSINEHESGQIHVPILELETLCTKAVEKLGYSPEDAAVVTEVLMYAELRGNDQGVAKIFSPVLQRDPSEGQIEVNDKSMFSYSINGNQRVGAVVLSQATDLVIDKAKLTGLGMAGMFNSGPASGALGYYLKKITSHGLVGLILAQSAEYVAPHGSSEPIFGTNPLAVGIPRQNDSALIIDMSTAAMSLAGVKEVRAKGEQLPVGIAYDATGNLTIDPNKALEGALRTFDKSYKSSHLSLIVEILGGLLPGGSAVDKHTSRNCGTLVVAFRPDIIGNSEDFLPKIEATLARIKNSKKASSIVNIQLPGEKGESLSIERLKTGSVKIDMQVYKSLKDHCQQ